MRTLVEPFRHQKLGAGAHRPALAFDLDLDAHKSLRRRVDDDRAEPERPGKGDRTFKKGDVSYGQTIRHQAIFCLSMISSENRFPLFRIMFSVQRALGEKVLANPLHQFGEGGIGHRIQ